VAIGITANVFVAEAVGAAITGSLALLADAGHMLSDLGALVLALVAASIAARPASDRQTYGYRRAEVFAALLNGVVLVGVVAVVAIEGVRRLVDADAVEVAAGPMLVVAVVGCIANAAALLVLRGGIRNSINMRGAYLEVLGDLLGSAAVVIAAIVILTTGFAAADGIASLLIAALIVPRALALIREAVGVLSESTPRGTEIALIRDHVLSLRGVRDVHDVHVWAITPGSNVFSAHVVVDDAVLRTGGSGRLLDELNGCLADHFDVGHSTFQLEPADHAAREDHDHP